MLRELICSVLCAAVKADRQGMVDARMAEHGYPGPYTDAMMCFGYDWNVDVSLFEQILTDACTHGIDHLDMADPCEWEADFWERCERVN